MGRDIEKSVERARERVGEYLAECKAEDVHGTYFRNSKMVPNECSKLDELVGTWSGIFAGKLVGWDLGGKRERESLASWINEYQAPDGSFTAKGIFESDRRNNEEYQRFHLTNYAVGALSLLGESPRFELTFMREYESAEDLESWLARRDMSRPWTEGNNIVNLASFYAILDEQGCEKAGQRLSELRRWHIQSQNLQTGFWHADGGQRPELLINAMAGAAHNLHLFYYLEEGVPKYERIIDSCLRLGYLGIRSACVDIDMVDILTNLRRFDYRTSEIDRVLEKYLMELLQVQNRDGGFSDNYVVSPLKGVSVPATTSTTIGTWFRAATMGMIAEILIPSPRRKWTFRDTLGMGYFNRRFCKAGMAESRGGGERVAWSKWTGVWLAARRIGRFQRQRATLKARRLLGC